MSNPFNKTPNCDSEAFALIVLIILIFFMRIVRGDAMNITKWFRCNDCWKFHEDAFDAKNCCEPTIFYKCGECGYHHQYDDDAVKCCNPNENEKLKEQLKLG